MSAELRMTVGSSLELIEFLRFLSLFERYRLLKPFASLRAWAARLPAGGQGARATSPKTGGESQSVAELGLPSFSFGTCLAKIVTSLAPTFESYSIKTTKSPD